jgi:hypothetical protein
VLHRLAPFRWSTTTALLIVTPSTMSRSRASMIDDRDQLTVNDWSGGHEVQSTAS